MGGNEKKKESGGGKEGKTVTSADMAKGIK